VATPHPPTSSLVTEAIEKLNEKGGSSLQAIKKSIADAHQLNVERLAPFIRKYLKNAVEKGLLLQPKGKGATGSFKLAVKPKPAAAAGDKKPRAKKAVKSPSKTKSPASKKPSLLLLQQRNKRLLQKPPLQPNQQLQ
jgi:histone H1/5